MKTEKGFKSQKFIQKAREAYIWKGRGSMGLGFDEQSQLDTIPDCSSLMLHLQLRPTTFNFICAQNQYCAFWLLLILKWNVCVRCFQG